MVTVVILSLGLLGLGRPANDRPQEQRNAYYNAVAGQAVQAIRDG